MTRRRSWLWQIVAIEGKGYDAFLAGKSSDDIPYKPGGGSVQQQRRAAWRRGYELAKRESRK